jgi:hypothetical protein
VKTILRHLRRRKRRRGRREGRRGREAPLFAMTDLKA